MITNFDLIFLLIIIVIIINITKHYYNDYFTFDFIIIVIHLYVSMGKENSSRWEL